MKNIERQCCMLYRQNKSMLLKVTVVLFLVERQWLGILRAKEGLLECSCSFFFFFLKCRNRVCLFVKIYQTMYLWYMHLYVCILHFNKSLGKKIIMLRSQVYKIYTHVDHDIYENINC